MEEGNATADDTITPDLERYGFAERNLQGLAVIYNRGRAAGKGNFTEATAVFGLFGQVSGFAVPGLACGLYLACRTLGGRGGESGRDSERWRTE